MFSALLFIAAKVTDYLNFAQLSLKLISIFKLNHLNQFGLMFRKFGGEKIRESFENLSNFGLIK